MNVQDRQALIKEMSAERKALLETVSISAFLTNMVRKKAKDIVDRCKESGYYSLKGKKLLKIVVYRKSQKGSYLVKIDNKEFYLLEEELEEMKTVFLIINLSGYGVDEKEPIAAMEEQTVVEITM